MSKPPPAIQSLFVGQPESLGVAGAAAWFDEAWTTAIFKRRLDHPVALGTLGLAGDGHADSVNHGGPDKAICVYPAVHYAVWRDQIARQPDGDTAAAECHDGGFGENLTVTALTERDVCVGDTYAVGSAVVEISQPRQPCWKLARRWRIKDFAAQAVANGFTGWYFRVHREGRVAVGDTFALVARPHPEWTVAAANLVMHHRVGDAKALVDVAALSESWKRTLRSRVAGA